MEQKHLKTGNILCFQCLTLVCQTNTSLKVYQQDKKQREYIQQKETSLIKLHCKTSVRLI